MPEVPEARTCVYSLHEVDLDSLYSYKELSFERMEHEPTCALCKAEGFPAEDCEEAQDMCYFSEGGGWYSDVEPVWDEENKYWDHPGATILLRVNSSHPTVQLVRSPRTWERGLCSPCYPDQCDSSCPGELTCYRLPEDLERGED